MLLLGLGDQLAVLTSFDELQCNGSKKSWQKIVVYEDKSNP
jgi:hypothetical protein